MQVSLAVLNKKAIDAALKANWPTAVTLNAQILEFYPDNTDAKIRLGRALIQTKKFDKAKKIFKEVLKIDPINPVALKNLEIAKKGRLESKEPARIDRKSLLIEPGTTKEVTVPIITKGITSREFYSGETVLIKVKKRSIDIYKIKKDSSILAGTITNQEIVQKLNSVVENSGKVQGSFIKGKDKDITILIKTSKPVFKSEKQDIRPYIKKGIDDQDMEIEEEEEPITEEQ